LILENPDHTPRRQPPAEKPLRARREAGRIIDVAGNIGIEY
jgi:hypothetical protein